MGPKLKSAVIKTPKSFQKRRRTKRLHRELVDQLEFYVSEANLRHDPFMREIAGDNGMKPISIDLLLTFPLIQEMKVTEKNILNAIENSVILQVCSDEKHIRRQFPIARKPHNLEQSTLYIENLPPDTTIDWLKETCQKVGNVRYISLPRFKTTDLIKGFAFIEFSCPEDVARACRILRDPPINFFPNRNEKYLRRLNRVQKLRTGNSTDASPAKQEETEDSLIPNSGQNCSMEESELESQKLKRERSKLTDDALEDDTMVTPLKRRKTIDVQESESTTTETGSILRPRVNFIIPEGSHVMLTSSKSLQKLSKQNYTEQTPPDGERCGHDIMNGVDVLENGETCQQSTPATSEFGSCGNGDSASVKNRSVLTTTAVSLNQDSITTDSIVPRVVVERTHSDGQPEGDTLPSSGKKGHFQECSKVSETSLCLDIDQMILEGRQQAQESKVQCASKVTFKQPLQSVVAIPAMKQPIMQHKKFRRRRSRDRKKERLRRMPPILTVMPKVQWMEMKKEYKRVQKESMGKLKQTIRENNDAGSVFIKKHLDVLHDVNISNESVAACDVNSGSKEHKLLKRGPPTFQPGVIVQIIAVGGERLLGVEEIRSLLNRYGQGVAYIDVEAGYARFNDGESAQRAILEEKSLSLCLLTGQQEEQYWDKLLASRARKYARERPKIRGRTKILHKAERLVENAKRRHIRFDNDFAL